MRDLADGSVRLVWKGDGPLDDVAWSADEQTLVATGRRAST